MVMLNRGIVAMGPSALVFRHSLLRLEAADGYQRYFP